MVTIKYAIIDDDELLHKELMVLMKSHIDFECVAHYYDALNAVLGLKEVYVDMVFLDMELRNTNGYEIIKHLSSSVKVVVISSHSEYALAGYEYNIIDYLTKPIRPMRLFDALHKIKSLINNEKTLDVMRGNANNGPNPYILVSVISKKRTISIMRNQIYYIKKNGNYCEIVTYDNNNYLKYVSMKNFIKELSPEFFLFVNKSLLININSAFTTDGKTVRIDNMLYDIVSSDKDRFIKIDS